MKGRVFIDLYFGGKPKIVQTITLGSYTLKGQDNMSLALPSGKHARVTLQLLDVYGNPTKFDEPPVWVVSDDALLTVTAEGDGYTADVRSVGPMGGGQVRASGDADLGEGTRQFEVIDDVEVIAGDASSGAFSWGPVED
jgi:hypothetical protein